MFAIFQEKHWGGAIRDQSNQPELNALESLPTKLSSLKFSRFCRYQKQGSRYSVLVSILCLPGLLLLDGHVGQQPDPHAREWAARQAAYRDVELRRSGSRLEITVNTPRPLDDVAAALAHQHGWHVNYEDPIWAKSDLVDSTAPEWLASHANGRHVFSVSGGEFHAVIAADGYFPDDPLEVLPKLVEAYNRSGNPGRFQLRPSESRPIDWFDIIPVAAGDGPQTPLLDTVMSFDASPSDNTFVTMRRFAKELSAASGQKVICNGSGNPVDNIPFQTFIEQHSSHQPAREILRQMLPQISSGYSWRLLHDPDEKTFWLQWR